MHIYTNIGNKAEQTNTQTSKKNIMKNLYIAQKLKKRQQ